RAAGKSDFGGAEFYRAGGGRDHFSSDRGDRLGGRFDGGKRGGDSGDSGGSRGAGGRGALRDFDRFRFRRGRANGGGVAGGENRGGREDYRVAGNAGGGSGD